MALAACLSACGTTAAVPDGAASADLAMPNGPLPDLVVPADLVVPPDLVVAPDGGCVIAASPSGYQCDPWSAHLYMSTGLLRTNQTLRLQLRHDPDQYEGNPNDFNGAPPEHAFYQTLTVDMPLDQAARSFLCVVLSTGGAPVDASAPGFLASTMHHPQYSLVQKIPTDFLDHLDNLIDVCGGSMLAQVAAPRFAMNGTVLPDVAVAVPLVPKVTDFAVGTKFTAWLARGYLGVDEESELSPAITFTVVGVQQN